MDDTVIVEVPTTVVEAGKKAHETDEDASVR